MNKIVLENYPVEKLPKDLQARLSGLNAVTLTLEEEVVQRHPLAPEDLLRFLDRPYSESVNTVESIRSLRDEWN